MMEMIVNMDCQGCERKVRKALENLDGVQKVDIEMNLQKVTVTGWVNPEKVLKKVRRTGKKAELWPFPNNTTTIGFTQQYANMYKYHRNPATYFNDQQQPMVSSHNYDERRWYNNDYRYLEMPYSSISDRATFAFSDDNVNACSVM
ncbi:hypothetical protein E3N88_19124 [Mikania micrantha]|uniref:HMA domain-containing protein n=1 Tax=Mikania micrantha TaxID=192012 RepID=A0A5N6NQ07_9ASTR|nr:hypothetical protein E3N88_19124 [Mikania micrantha]